LRSIVHAAGNRLRVFVLIQDAMGNVIECQHRILGANGPVAQLESIIRRDKTALRKILQDTPR
jgi:hypothetical protein